MKKIWEWAWRDIYLFEDNDNLCLKKLKSSKRKNIFWFKFNVNQKIYTLLNFWISNFNEHDYKNLLEAKKLIPENMPEYIELTDEWLVESVIRDYNWKVSRNLKSFNHVLPKDFFEKLERLLFFLIENWIEIMDIINNVLVQEYEPNKFKPILFDFKRIWWRTYILQPWLLFSKDLRVKKIYRRLNRLKDLLSNKPSYDK